jgi:hypothetical protein
LPVGRDQSAMMRLSSQSKRVEIQFRIAVTSAA